LEREAFWQFCSANVTIKWHFEIGAAALATASEHPRIALATKPRFCFRAIKRKLAYDQVQPDEGTHSNDFFCNGFIDIFNRFENTFTEITFFISVAKFKRLFSPVDAPTVQQHAP